MSQPTSRQPPAGSIEREDFYADEERRNSHLISYGSAWKDPSWTGDDSHVVELLWLSRTRELVACYIRYDWSRLAPGRLGRDAVLNEAADVASLDSGIGIGRYLSDLDLATADVRMVVLGVLPSALRCHELLWDWRWLQHHNEGLSFVRQRLAELADHEQS